MRAADDAHLVAGRPASDVGSAERRPEAELCGLEELASSLGEPDIEVLVPIVDVRDSSQTYAAFWREATPLRGRHRLPWVRRARPS